jgi:hypothetical protein
MILLNLFLMILKACFKVDAMLDAAPTLAATALFAASLRIFEVVTPHPEAAVRCTLSFRAADDAAPTLAMQLTKNVLNLLPTTVDRIAADTVLSAWNTRLPVAVAEQ